MRLWPPPVLRLTKAPAITVWLTYQGGFRAAAHADSVNRPQGCQITRPAAGGCLLASLTALAS